MITKNDKIIHLNPNDSEQACRAISATLPEWFGIPEANERYAQGVKDRLCFGYLENEHCLGMLCLGFPFQGTANIYWMGVKKKAHQKGIGKALLRYAEKRCQERNIHSLTVETLSPKEKDIHYLKTYQFYTKQGFRPLFELNTYGPDYLMIYLNKIISSTIFTWIDLTHGLTEKIPTWDGDCGFQHHDISKNEDASSTQFYTQRIEMLAGIGTHLDAPAHCISGGKTIAEIPLKSLISPCIVINVSEQADEHYCVNMEVLALFEKKYGKIEKNTFVIFYTGWQRFWNQKEKYRSHFPSLSKEVADYLVAADVAGIGIDTLSPDRPESGFPVHQTLLAADKYIVENITNADKMPPIGGYSFVMPIRCLNGTEAPIRLLGAYIT